MKFPGSKLLYQVDLASSSASVSDMLRSCEQAGLTGFAELVVADGVGMIFYYLGTEANALFREGAAAFQGTEARERIRKGAETGAGSLAVYELPLDMAHLLRGITNRRRLPQALDGRRALDQLLDQLEVQAHTGTLEVQTQQGAAMLLLVGGKASNCYFETAGGVTLEKGEAREKLALALSRDALCFLADFSASVSKGRHELESPVRSRLQAGFAGAGAEPLSAEEEARREALQALAAGLPGLVQAFVFDLSTGVVFARHGRGSDALRVALLAEKVPRLTQYLRDLVAASQDDEVELVEFQTARSATLVAVVPGLQHAFAVIADKTQPTALIGAALQRAAGAYAERVLPLAKTPAD